MIMFMIFLHYQVNNYNKIFVITPFKYIYIHKPEETLEYLKIPEKYLNRKENKIGEKKTQYDD